MTLRVCIYRFATGVCRLVINTFFSRVEVQGQENVPKSGPTLFTVNHPNGLLDALFVVLYSGRKTSLLVKAPLFRTPVVGFFVRQLESLPVYRRQENDNPLRNKQIIVDAIALLRRGNTLTLFPEGTSHSDFEVKKLRTGAARMALSASSKTVSPDAVPATIVPVGLYYTDKEAFRSKALVVFGKPFATPNVKLDHNFRPPGQRVAEFTKTIRAALSDLILTAPAAAVFRLARDIEAVAAASAADEQLSRSIQPKARTLMDRLRMQQALVDGYLRAQEESKERLAEIASLVACHSQTLSRAGLPMDQTLVVSAGKAVGGFLWACLSLVLLSPLLVVGFSTNYLTCLVIGYVARRYAKGEADITASGKATLGVALFPLTWLVGAIAIGLWLGWIWFMPALVLLPVAAYITLFATEWTRNVFRRMRAALRLTLQPKLRNTIAQEREQIVAAARELI